MGMGKSPNSESTHFAIHTITEGIFAAIAKDGSASCNAGLIDLGGQIIVFDAFITPQAAADLRRFALDTYGMPPQIVINSHYHNDHIWGSQVFADDAQIISSTRTRELIATSGKEEFEWYSANTSKQLDSLKEKYKNAKDDQERKDLTLFIDEYEGLMEAFPHLKMCLPGITFEGLLDIHGVRQSARLITFEGGHTGSDTILYLPQTGIVYMGDLLFVNFHPFLADGDPLKLLEALREIIKLDANQFIPGHGPIGTIEDVKLEIAYIENCVEMGRSLIKDGKAIKEKINGLLVPEKFSKWEMSRFYNRNIQFVCERLSAGEK